MLQERIVSLKKELIEYGILAEEMIEKSIRGLTDRDHHPLAEIMEQDEPKANSWEVKLDQMCTTTIARFEPKAKDLRTILMVLKISNDLERIADHAVNIAESSLFLIHRPPVKRLIDLPAMADIVINMLKDSISSFIDEKVELAREVCQRDDKVDGLRDQILRELITFMSSDPATIERAIHLLRVATNLERIADLSTNYCEDVIYIVEGKVIKHHLDDKQN